MRLMSRIALTAMLLAVAAPAVAGGPPAAGAVLTGPEWRLVEIPGGAAVLPGVTIAFGSDGSASGHAGCNRFRGRYVRDGAALTVGALAMTKMACRETARSAQEQAVVGALAATRSHALRGGRLELRDARGTPVLIYRRP